MDPPVFPGCHGNIKVKRERSCFFSVGNIYNDRRKIERQCDLFSTVCLYTGFSSHAFVLQLIKCDTVNDLHTKFFS